MISLMTKTIHEIIANNVNRLIDYNDQITQTKTSQDLLAKKTGISQKTISNVLKPGSVGSITTDTIEKLAKYFKLEPYHLMIPNLPIEELLSKRIEKVIECYAQSSLDSRENIERIAKNEMRYSALPKENSLTSQKSRIHYGNNKF